MAILTAGTALLATPRAAQGTTAQETIRFSVTLANRAGNAIYIKRARPDGATRMIDDTRPMIDPQPPARDRPTARLNYRAYAEWTAEGPRRVGTGFSVNAYIPAAGGRQPAIVRLTVSIAFSPSRRGFTVSSRCLLVDSPAGDEYRCDTEKDPTSNRYRGTRHHFILSPIR
jgi:hypothetical protein